MIDVVPLSVVHVDDVCSGIHGAPQVNRQSLMNVHGACPGTRSSIEIKGEVIQIVNAITVAFPIWSQQHKGPLAAQEQIRAKSRRIPEQAIVDRQCFVSGEYPPLEKRR